jgi:CheY-like chemotaxis protein
MAMAVSPITCRRSRKQALIWPGHPTATQYQKRKPPMNVLIGMPAGFICRRPAISAVDGCIEPLLIQSDFSAHLKPPVILVVDDEPDVGNLVHQLLCYQFPQIEIIVSADPIEALQHVQERTVVLVIADFNMPNMSGLQLIEKVRECSPQTKVLLITAYTTAILESLARQRDVDYYMAKPFNLTDLEDLVGEVVTAYEARRAATDAEAKLERRAYRTHGNMILIY